MSKTTKAAAKPATLTDDKTGAEYTPCNAPTPDGGVCLRYTGHSTAGKKGAHRPSLYRPLKPETVAQRAAWKAMTPEQQEAELQRRRDVTAARKAAASVAAPAMASSAARPGRKPATKRTRAMGSGPVRRQAAATS